jgi:teichuronic acid biosynthesis glycosyltransferase TuaC
MKVLFVCSGNSSNGIGTVVINQAESIRKLGVQIEFFPLIGKGFTGYVKNIPRLRKYARSNNFDVIHAHYSASAFVASLAVSRPLAVSLMGSDAYMSRLWSLMAKFFYYLRWDATIVKTIGMKNKLRLKNVYIIPNGVDLEKYILMAKNLARDYIRYPRDKKLVIFLADPSRDEKDFKLANLSIKQLDRKDVDLVPVFNVPNSEIPYYLNAADVLLLTSKWEGSVNVVKEAMASNLPIVSTNVGDVEENAKDVTGCYICESNPLSLAEGLKKSLKLEFRTNGREKILKLKLDSESVAKKILAIYEDIVEGR